ncbi:MAG: FG-GAP repeat domain-containing protein [Giesbergeria sp.]
MSQWCVWFGRLAGVVAALLALGCQLTPTSLVPDVVGKSPATPNGAVPQAVHLDLPDAWGGGVLCSRSDCLLGAVEHENGKLSLFRVKGRAATLLDQQPLAYHPDSAAWLSSQLLVAAVEKSASLDIFRVIDARLARLAQVYVGFAPRDVLPLSAPLGKYRMLATPYGGRGVAWVDWSEEQPQAVRVHKADWCQAPWHPTRVSQVPQSAQEGIAVACLDDKTVVVVPEADLSATPKVLARFAVTPRQVRPSPSGLWLYVALETGERNARIQMQTGELQWIAGDPRGSSAVVALADDLVIWGDDRRLMLQRLDDAGVVLETRELPTSGYSTSLQLQDIDDDGHLDILVLNSAGKRADIIYGPLWEQAKPRP